MRGNTITIDTRFRGPPQSGNGGYSCGRLACFVDGPARVRLMAPPPLERPMRVAVDDDGVARLWDGATQVAEARPTALDVDVPAMPGFAEAREASRAFSGFVRHIFPGCFVCGPQRAAGDGMQVFAGPLGRDGIVASPWMPHADLCSGGVVRPEFLWSALDCPGAFAVMPEEPGRAIVLGQLEGWITATVAAETPCVVIGWPIAIDGRKRTVGTAIADADGRVVARARAVWIEVPGVEFSAAL
jgi:hypothetical protein